MSVTVTRSLIAQLFISFRIPTDTLSHFVHPLNGLVRWNLVKQIFSVFDDKLFVG